VATLLEELQIRVNQLDRSGIQAVNSMLKVRWQTVQRMELIAAVGAGLRPGAEVMVDLRDRGQHAGRVLKVKQKYVLVRLDQPVGRGRDWNVMPGSCTVKEANPNPWDDV
jgi:hypothetical protein